MLRGFGTALSFLMIDTMTVTRKPWPSTQSDLTDLVCRQCLYGEFDLDF